MKKFVYHLRGKSEEVRRRILYILTIVAGVILVFLWLFSLGTNFSSEETQEELQQDLAPFSVLQDNLSLPSW